MILNYYQAVELMDALPSVLSPVIANTGEEEIQQNNSTDEEDSEGIYQMWSASAMPPALEVNGSAFD